MTDELSTPGPEFAYSTDARAPAPADEQHHRAKPWFRQKRFLPLLALVLLMVIIEATYGGGWSSLTAGNDAGSKVTSAPRNRAVAAGIGTKVRDGKFEFVVTSIERPGRTLPGKNNTTLNAQGEFVIVRVTATNVGSVAQSLDCQCQLLFNDKGEKFGTSSAILSTKDALKFVQLIHPGTTVKNAVVLFDVAPGTKISDVELHDSALTQGAKVTLR
jgi:hypothetical protein